MVTYLVHLLIGTGSTEAVETELLVRVSLPAHGAHGLNAEDWKTVREDGETVLLVLSIEDLEARDGDDTGRDVVLLLQVLGSINANADLRAGGDNGDSSVLRIESNVSTLERLLNAGGLEMGKVLTGKGEDAGSVLGSQSRVVGSAGLVAISRTPHHEVRQGTEVGKSLDRLVSRAVFTKTNGVVRRDIDGPDLREGGQTHGAGSIGDEVQEGTASGDHGAVSSHTVHGSSHGMFTDTISEVPASIITELENWGLEVNSALPPGVVGASQIGRSRHELRDGLVDLLKDGLGEFPRGNSRVG